MVSLDIMLNTLCFVSTLWMGTVMTKKPDGCFGVLDISFVIDQSESIRENDPVDQPSHNWNVIKNFVKSVVGDLPLGLDTQVAMVKYSTEPQLMWRLNKYKNYYEFNNAVDTLTHDGGNTNTAAALKLTRRDVFRSDKGDRTYGKNIIILMTDGLSTNGKSDLKYQALLASQANIEVYVVAIGNYVDEDEMRDIVNDFSKNILTADNFDELQYIQQLLVHRVCGLPDPPVEPQGDTSQCENTAVDLAFIVDNSRSIGLARYKCLKQFLIQFVKQFETTLQHHRFAVVRFSDVVHIEFMLGMYRDYNDLRDRIYRMGFRDNDTNIAAGIRETINRVFSPSSGDRLDVRNVALLISDGESNKDMDRVIPEAERAKSMGIEMYVIGVTGAINYDELRTVASDPDRTHFFDATNVCYLQPLILQILPPLCP